MHTRVTALLEIEVPIIQGGMVWASGWRLASAVSETGGLGVIGAGSMKPDLLAEHIRKAKEATARPIGVNIPLMRGDAWELAETALGLGIKRFFSSSGTPQKFTQRLKERGCTVVHVVAAVKHARKAEEAGCDAVVAEGYEAGGHDGLDELTTLALVPQVVDAVGIPVIAAGGIADGRQMCAAFALGAEAVQVGTRFAATREASAHDRYKQAVVESDDTGTVFTFRGLMPVRMLKSPFALRARDAERSGASKEDLASLLGEKRERRGIFDGDWEEGMFEAGQSAGLIKDVPAAGEIVRRMMKEFDEARQKLDAKT